MFKRLIHPELIAGKRGPAFERKALKTAMDRIRIIDGRPHFHSSLLGILDTNNQLCFSLMKLFLSEEKKQIFHFSRDFLTALIANYREMPVELLPRKFSAYLSFPDDLVRDEVGDFYQGAYVRICPNLGFSPSAASSRVWIYYGAIGQQTEAYQGMTHTLTFLAELEKGQTIDEIFRQAPLHWERSRNDPKAPNSLFEAIVAGIVYIHSQNPVLEHLPSMGSLSKKERALLTDSDDSNGCTLPVTFVNWRWQRPVGLHGVSGHWKWQACGERLSQRRFIFIEDYQRGKECLTTLASGGADSRH